MDRERLRAWLVDLPKFDHYQMLGLDRGSGHEDVQKAFHAFSTEFHPDRHRGRSPDEHEAVSRIFRRGAEAYRVLSSPELRAKYDQERERGKTSYRPSLPIVEMGSMNPASGGPAGRLEDHVTNPSARPFARKAEELIQEGNLPMAKLQLSLALNKDPGNEALRALMEEIAAKSQKRP